MENAITEKITMTKELVLSYALEIGYFSFFDSQVHYEKGFSLDDQEFCQKFLQAEIDRRRDHLDETVSVFQRKMNALDPSINLQKGEMVPFEYEADLFVTFTMPERLGQSAILRLSSDQLRAYQKQQEEEEARYRRWKEFADAHGGINNVKQKPLFNKIIPGRPSERVKVGSVKVIGYKCVTSFERPGFRIEGMNFIGKVAPYVNSDNVEMQYANVDLVDEYADDAELIEYLKKTSAQVRCDFCGRKSARDIYFLFKDPNNKIHYYGRNCAEKAFGVDIIEKLDRFMRGLYILGQEVCYNEKGRNATEDEITCNILAMMYTNTLNSKIDYKTIESEASRFMGPLKAFREDPNFDYSVYYGVKPYYDFYKENVEEAERLCATYMAYGTDFYRNYTVSNDFSEKLKAFSLALLSGDSTAFRKMPRWVLPFSLNNFFRFFKREKVENNAQDAEGAEARPMPYPMFDSYKRFNCEIVGTKDATTKYGKPYRIYTAYATENGVKYGIMWYDFKMNGTPLYIGDKVIVQGTYSKFNKAGSEFTNLDNTTVAPSEVSDAQTSSMADMSKYEVGNRLRDTTVIVSKVMPRYIIIETEDGIKFMVYTSVENRFGEQEPKFAIDFSEGQKLSITGTVQRSAKGYLFLNRCKINALNESVMRINESDIKQMVCMALDLLYESTKR